MKIDWQRAFAWLSRWNDNATLLPKCIVSRSGVSDAAFHVVGSEPQREGEESIKES